MALLIVDLDKYIGNAQAWRDTLAEQMPELKVRIWPDNEDLNEVEYLAFMHPNFDAMPALPNLKAMFSRSAGVESFVNHPKMPKCPLGKIEPSSGDPMMTEYTVEHVAPYPHMPVYHGAGAARMVAHDDRAARAASGRFLGCWHDGECCRRWC